MKLLFIGGLEAIFIGIILQTAIATFFYWLGKKSVKKTNKEQQI